MNMSSLKNRVMLIGRLAQSPEIIKFESGGKAARINLITQEPYKEKNGEWNTNEQYHYAFAWGILSDSIGKKLVKGSEIVLQGRLVNRTFERIPGDIRCFTEIEIEEFLLLNPGRDDD